MEINEKTLMKEVLVDHMRNVLSSDPDVVMLDADLAKCAGTNGLYKEFPDRCFDIGIAEANMASMAAGLSSYGFKPYISSFAPFATRRCADQIMISICYAQQNVKIIGTDPGITAELNGGTHMALEDIGMLRSIPNILIYEPTDTMEFHKALPQIHAYPYPCYIRMHRKCPALLTKESDEVNILKARMMREGTDCTIVASGVMVETALLASEELQKEGISVEVVCCHTVKPIDADTIVASAKKTGAVVTAENHNVMGALRSAVCEVLSENHPVPVESVGVKEKFGEVGKVPYLRKAMNMEVCDVVFSVKKAIARK
ncbi:MAG: transketolase family protein [Clostridia bacterium]|nr:transketolase family protein [Clostridia bacterium]